MIYVLDFVLLSWVYWLILALLLFIPHLVLEYGKQDFQTGALLLPLAALGVSWYRYPALFPHTVGAAAVLAGAYLLAGAIYTVARYLHTLRRFRNDVDALIGHAPGLAVIDKVTHLEANLCGWGSDWKAQYEIVDGVARLKWNMLPLANWWVYWPWFLCASVFDFVTNLGTRLVAAFKGLWQGLANRFAVKL